MRSNRFAHIDDFLQTHYIDTGKLPCSQVLIAQHGTIEHQSSQGMADVKRHTPIEDNSLFRIYSMTKPLTSLAFMMLVEQSKVALDDPVSAYIPAWKNMTIHTNSHTDTAGTRPMLMIDLLRHTSGLTYGFQHSTPVDAAYRQQRIGESGTLENMMTALGHIPLDFSPGTAWTYSIATDVVGYLVGLISGQPLDAFFKIHITGPLGMVDTDFHVTPQSSARLSACYKVKNTGGFVLQDDPATSPFLNKPEFMSGGGGLISTTADYYRFCSMILNGGSLDGHQYIRPETLAMMARNQLPDGQDLKAMARGMFSESDYAGVGFGLGFATVIDENVTPMSGHAGTIFWGGMASTFFWIDPAAELITIFMTQLMPSSTYPVRKELRRLVYEALA